MAKGIEQTELPELANAEIAADEKRLRAMPVKLLVSLLIEREVNLSHAQTMDRGADVIARKTAWCRRARTELDRRLEVIQ